MQYSDKPIQKLSDDLLGRAPFALSLARAIDNLAVARDGFVIALLGIWGSGKTSVINLTCRYLLHLEMQRLNQSNKQSSERLTLLELESLAESFEKALPALDYLRSFDLDVSRADRDGRWREIRRYVESDTEADRADRYWRLRQGVEEHPHTIIIRFSPLLISGRTELATALVIELARTLGSKLGENVRRAVGKILQRLLELAPLAGAGLDLVSHGSGFGSLMRLGRDASSKFLDRMTSGPSLYELKEELTTVLSRVRDQQVLVIIDDLDRVIPSEALELVSVVKSLADLPNVIYLLGYDEARLGDLLRDVIKVDGHDFLDKIVQYPVHLPTLGPEDLSRMIDIDLDKLLPNLDENDLIRIRYAWAECMRHYIRTPRDVRRIINSYGVALSGLRDYTDPIDLLLLETLRLHDVEIYRYVRENVLSLAS